MKQLVELQQQAEKFEVLDADVIVVSREEQTGVDGLKKIRKASKSTFTLAVDLNKESSGAWSPKKSDFKNYVIDRTGIVREILPGKKTRRASADQLLDALKKLQRSRDES